MIDFSEMIEVPYEKENFEVIDMKSADWCVAKIGEAQKRMEERGKLVADYKDRLDEWLNKTNNADRQTVEYMNALVQPWAEIEIMKGKSKSLKLPCGTIGIRAGRESVRIDDETAAIEWAEAFKPKAVKVTKSILKSEVKGTDCPGYHVETGSYTFYVKPDEALFKLEVKNET